jgi:hypothetical protein
MTEFEETKLLANHVLERSMADPDDDLAMLSRQFLRQVETVERLKADLIRLHDPMGDLVHANRDEILRKHEEAARKVRTILERSRKDTRAWSVSIDEALSVLDALNQFHPMHADSWCGWPDETNRPPTGKGE